MRRRIKRHTTNPLTNGPPLGQEIQTVPPNLTQAHPLVDATVPQLASIMRAAERGQMTQIQDLYDDMDEKDTHLSAVRATRENAITKLDWDIIPPKSYAQDAGAQQIAKNVKEIFDDFEEWENVESHLVSGIGNAYAWCEMEWGMNSRGWWVPKDFHLFHPNRINFVDSVPHKYDPGIDPYPGHALRDYPRDKFVFHAPITSISYIQRRGIMRRCIFAVFLKRHGIQWFATGLERMGVPGFYAEVPDNEGEALDDDIIEAAKNFQQDWVACFPVGAKLVAVPGSGQFTGEAHTQMIKIADYQISKAWLGQVSTTDPVSTGLGSQLPVVQNEVRLDILEKDVKQLQMTIRRDIIRAIVRANWPGGVVPYYIKTIEERRKEIPAHYIGTKSFTHNEIRGTVGFPSREDGNEIYQPPDPAKPLFTNQEPSKAINVDSVIEGEVIGLSDDSPFALTASASSQTSMRSRRLRALASHGMLGRSGR